MANLGTIGWIEPGAIQIAGTNQWTTYVYSKDPIGMNEQEGIVFGEAQVAGVTAPNHKVMLIDRESRVLVRTTYSDANGDFVFKMLDLDPEKYMAMIQDEGEPVSYNSNTIDKLTAVNINL